MPINLSKGQKVDLTKGNPGLKNIMVGLGWDVNAFDTGADFDLDAAAFMCGSDRKRIYLLRKSGTSDRMCQTYGRQSDRFRRRR